MKKNTGGSETYFTSIFTYCDTLWGESKRVHVRFNNGPCIGGFQCYVHLGNTELIRSNLSCGKENSSHCLVVVLSIDCLQGLGNHIARAGVICHLIVVNIATFSFSGLVRRLFVTYQLRWAPKWKHPSMFKTVLKYFHPSWLFFFYLSIYLSVPAYNHLFLVII